MFGLAADRYAADGCGRRSTSVSFIAPDKFVLILFSGSIRSARVILLSTFPTISSIDPHTGRKTPLREKVRDAEGNIVGAGDRDWTARELYDLAIRRAWESGERAADAALRLLGVRR